MNTTTTKPRGTKTQMQLKAIFALAKVQSIDEAALRDLVEVETGKRSIRALNKKEADAVIVKLGGTPQAKGPSRRTQQYRRAKAGVIALVTPEQTALINELAARRNWTDESLTKFCQGQIKKDRPHTSKEAQRIIETLKSMNRRDATT